MNRFVNSTALQLALREMRDVFRNPRTIGSMVVVAIILGISGPFQTFEALNLAGRLAYWAAMTFITFTLGSFFGTWMTHAIDGKKRAGLIKRLGLLTTIPVSLAVAIPVCVSVIGINAVAFRDLDLSPQYFATIAGYCVIISFAITLMFALFSRTKPEDKNAPPRLLQRLPVAKRGALISLSVEDHYVAVRTQKGVEMILMRLSDAIAEAEGTKGLQIHRSHWVAFDGIKAVHKRQGKLVIETIGGEELPVSRTYAGAVKQAGLAV